MEITATALKKNLGYYLEVSQQEDIYIRKNGKLISKLGSSFEDKRSIVDSLVGILPENYDANAILTTKRNQI